MLVRGVNHFVPHAFSMNDFPDADCPPHFYAQGHNPQFEGFKQLMVYMNRLSYLFSDGKHQADIAVLYHAEAEWAGAYMPIQKVARELMEHQYEFEIVSVEMMLDAQYTNQTFVINEHHKNERMGSRSKRRRLHIRKHKLQLSNRHHFQ